MVSDSALGPKVSRPEALPEVMSIDQVAEVLGCGVDAVRRLIHHKGLPASHPLRRWIVRRDAFLRWLEAMEKEALTEGRIEDAIRGARR